MTDSEIISRETIPIVDWLSFTVDAPMHRRTKELQWMEPLNKHLCRRQALSQVYKVIGKDAMDALFGSLETSTEVGRFPYGYTVIDTVSSARVSFDSKLDHISVEISGKGCKLLHELSQTQQVCMVVSTLCTRVDVSCDIRTAASPAEFIAAGYNDRIKSSMTVTSPTGVTEYIGSPSSDKRAAVYRYAPPHPRAPFLRVEHRYRRQAAKAMCNYVATNGLAMAVQYAGVDFNWKSQIWDMGGLEAVPLPKLEGDSRDPNFAQWLLRQVFPAMRRAERQGRIDDLYSFVQIHLFDGHGDDPDIDEDADKD